jgi:hypothetical protein
MKFSTEYTNIHGKVCGGIIEADSWEIADLIASEKPMKEVVTGEVVEQIEVSDQELSTFMN